jgi:uncharacterized protein (TIGR02145 family)
MPDQEWINIKTDACCNIFNDITKDSSYGKIYNGYTIKDRRGLAPKGWHISTAKDWEVLLKTYDGSVEKLKSILVWSNYPSGLNGTNESGLNLAPGGFRSSETGFFMNFGKCGDYWTKTVASSDEVVFERIVGENQNLHTLPGKLNLGLYVRCVKDCPPSGNETISAVRKH